MAFLSFILFSLISVTSISYSIYSLAHISSFKNINPNSKKVISQYKIDSITFNPSSRKTDSRIFMTSIALQPFNPFTARHKNTRVRWFESDMENFYLFVEQQPLLTHPQELQYGKAMSMWFQVEQMRASMRAELGSDKYISNEDLAKALGCSTITLEKMCKYAELSKTKLVNSNLRLVLAVVSRYRNSAIPNSELIAEGTRGLTRAVLRYDYKKGFRFATYATWYVHQSISDYVRWRKHPARMPSRYLILFRRVKEYTKQFKTTRSRMPSIEEISLGLKAPHFDIIKVLSMQIHPSQLGSSIQNRNTIKQNGRERSLEEILPSVYKTPNAQTNSKDLRRDMERIMQCSLSDVERDVLRLRLGLDDGKAKAVKEVGKRFKISWKQVRNVEREAMSKLLDSDEITGFVNDYNSDYCFPQQSY